MQKLSARLDKLEKLESQRAIDQPSQWHEEPSFGAAPEATPTISEEKQHGFHGARSA